MKSLYGLNFDKFPGHCSFNLNVSFSLSFLFFQNQEVNGKSQPKLHWVRHTKQGVYFIQSPPRIEDEPVIKENIPRVRYSVGFEPATGEIDFDFQLCAS